MKQREGASGREWGEEEEKKTKDAIKRIRAFLTPPPGLAPDLLRRFRLRMSRSRSRFSYRSGLSRWKNLARRDLPSLLTKRDEARDEDDSAGAAMIDDRDSRAIDIRARTRTHGVPKVYLALILFGASGVYLVYQEQSRQLKTSPPESVALRHSHFFYFIHLTRNLRIPEFPSCHPCTRARTRVCVRTSGGGCGRVGGKRKRFLSRNHPGIITRNRKSAGISGG